MTPVPVRRRPAAGLAVLAAALGLTGLVYAAVAGVGQAEAAAPTASATQVEQGRALYVEGCASCHGMNGQGNKDVAPPLTNVGAAAVDFQMSTGRMPLAEPGVQAPGRPRTYTDDEIAAIAAYVASFGPGPEIPTDDDTRWQDADLAAGGELFRTNCAQCHNFAGQGGALSNGRYAPSLMRATPREIYEAMLTGPSNMPVFGNATIPTTQKQQIIRYVEHLQTADSPGGFALGSFGPVTEGVFAWIAGMGALLAAAVWIGAKVR